MDSFKIYSIKSFLDKVFILDIILDDEVKMHRYYLLKNDNNIIEISRIRSIDELISLISNNNLDFYEVDDEKKLEILQLINNEYLNSKSNYSDLKKLEARLLKGLELKLNKLNINDIKKYDDNYNSDIFKHYLDKVNDFDIEFMEKAVGLNK